MMNKSKKKNEGDKRRRNRKERPGQINEGKSETGRISGEKWKVNTWYTNE